MNYVQITAARHAIQTDCGDGDAAVGSICCDILIMAGDTASKSGNTVSWGMPVWSKRIPRRLFRFIIKQYTTHISEISPG